MESTVRRIHSVHIPHFHIITFITTPDPRLVNVKRRRYFPFLDAGEVHFLSFAAEEEQIIFLSAVEKSKGVNPASVVQTENDAGGRDVVNAQTGSADDDSVIFAGGRPADQGT